MLSLTLEATHVIAEILAEPDVPEDGGMRIVLDAYSAGNGNRQLHVAIAASPDEDDAVIEQNGARVFVPAPLVEVLADKTLDVPADPPDGILFTLGAQSQPF
jgi:iron-sulfur cluster assembly protein